MDTARQRMEALFDAALELKDPAERAAFLERECGEDLPLRTRLERLLSAHGQSNKFFEDCRPSLVAGEPGNAIPPMGNAEEELGRLIGHYQLLQKIGEGGCGVVYLAEQEKPVRRRVALKIIKLGMDTRNVIARFEAERQALAMMDHPNIARVLDAGATQTGRPYFVMELVHHGILRPRPTRHTAAAGFVHPSLSCHPARASEGHHPPRHQAVEHFGDGA